MRDYVVNHENVKLNCGYVDLEEYPVEKGSYPWSIRVINDMNKGLRCGDERPKKYKKVYCTADAVEQFCEKYKDKESMYVSFDDLFKEVYGIVSFVPFQWDKCEYGYTIPYKDVHRFLTEVFHPYNNERVNFKDVLKLALDKYGDSCCLYSSRTYWDISHQLWEIINEWNIVGFTYEEKE